MDTDEWEENQADAEEAETNIRVFCCSSNEYQKLKGFNHTDGNPLVFDNVEDTQIPALKEYVHELTFSRRLKGLESLVQRLETCVLAFQSLLQNGIILANETRVDIEAQVEEELYQFQGQLHYAIKTLAVDLDELFNGKLRLLFIKGAKNAQMDASMICGKWGPPVNKGANRVHEVGLHWRSYRATVQRRGVFTLQSSKTCINFNHDLVEPIYKAMEHEWNNVFNLQLPQILDHTSEVLKKEMKICMNRLCDLLKCVPISQDEVNTKKIQLELSFSGKISDFLSQTNIEAMRKQREINRMLTPFIQLKMEDVYMNVASHTGKKASKNMRNCMSKGIEQVRKTMYHEAIEMLQGEFGTLQSFILKVIESQVSGLTEEIRKTFEAFWTFTYPSVSDLDSEFIRLNYAMFFNNA